MKNSIVFIVIFSVFSCNQKSEELHLTPLEQLKAGNERFSQNSPIHPHETLDRIRELKKGQHPFCVIVSCSDSRVPPELIFDQGLGDVFSIRTAGNIIGDYELGSIEYAVEHLSCKLIVVLGHEDCGAIETFVETDGHYPHLDHIKSIVDYLSEETEEQALLGKARTDLNEAVKANMIHGVKLLQTSEPIMNRLYQEKKIQIVGAMYDMDSGIVTFMEK